VLAPFGMTCAGLRRGDSELATDRHIGRSVRSESREVGEDTSFEHSDSVHRLSQPELEPEFCLEYAEQPHEEFVRGDRCVMRDTLRPRGRMK